MNFKIYLTRNIFRFTLLVTTCLFQLNICHSQTIKRVRPVWWLGQSVAGNFNHYRGTTQMLNESVSTQTPFHNGDGLRLYFSLLAEYRKNKIFGAMLNVAFNNRSSSFDGVMYPANTEAFLYTVLRYVNIEPSIRIAPFSSAFYLFTGPTLSINSTKEFFLEQPGEHEVRGNWSGLRKYVIGAQAGVGIDIPISKKESINQITLSPFVSFQTDMLDGPRNVETWSIYGYRAGMAFKFGTRKNKQLTKIDTVFQTRIDTVTVMLNDIQFSVKPPKVMAVKQPLEETFPLINSVFFNNASTSIPDRYRRLTKTEAADFNENDLQNHSESNLYTERNKRQLNVYYNILNILGGRLRTLPGSSITLSGLTSETQEGREMASSIKDYLVNIFGIDASRITIDENGHSYMNKKNHTQKEIALLEEEERRVDISSSSLELTMQVGSAVHPNIQTAGLSSMRSDSAGGNVDFTLLHASNQLESYTIQLTDEKGAIQKYGPYASANVSIPANKILGTSSLGNYDVELNGVSRSGKTFRKFSSLNLVQLKSESSAPLRFSVLFDFDRSKTIAANERFVTDVIAPLVTDSSYIFLHGHADVIGTDKYNFDLTGSRVEDIRMTLEKVLNTQAKKGLKIQYYGFGKNMVMAPFENNLPEERFYNRTVFIDIIPR